MRNSGFLWLCILWAGILLFSRCSKDSLDTYNPAETSIYFGVKNPSKATKNVFVDTTVFSFGDYEGLTDTIVQIRVNALGGLAHVDRKFEYEVVDSMTTATEGVHFILPGMKEGIIPGDSVCGYIPVHIVYSDGMKNKAMWYLVLQLKANSGFNLDLRQEYVDISNDKYVELTRHWIGMSSRIQKPTRWYQVESYFLEFSSDKYKLINQLCHLNKEDWDNIAFYIAETYWVAVRNYLQKNIDAGTPVMEQNERTGRKQIMKVKGLTGLN